MPNVKITEMTELTSPADGDFIPIVDISEVLDVNKNKKITFANLLSNILSKILHRRQGGSATLWNTGGTTSYTPSANAKIQVGARTLSITSPGVSSNFSVTFPVTLSYTPIIFLSLESATNNVSSLILFAQNVTASGFDCQYAINASVTHNVTITWMAIGE